MRDFLHGTTDERRGVRLTDNARMKFESLKIEAPSYGEDKGKLVAELSIKGEKSRTKMILPNEVGDRIFQIAKQALIDGVESAANDFICEIETFIPESLLLEHNTQDREPTE